MSFTKARKKYLDGAREEVMRHIDGLIAPGEMLAADALEFLGEFESDISARIDGLKDDIKNGDAE